MVPIHARRMRIAAGRVTARGRGLKKVIDTPTCIDVSAGKRRGYTTRRLKPARYELRATSYRLDVREIERPQQVIEPEGRQLLLHRVLPQADVQVMEIDVIHQLVLVEAGEDELLAAGGGIDVALQALRADLLHHALHRR